MAHDVVAIPGEAARLKRKIRSHLASLGFTKDQDGRLCLPGFDKQHYRDMHAHQRRSRIAADQAWIDAHAPALISNFASGAELDVKRIRPAVEVVHGGTWQADLFRLATYYWRIPISKGYGRRIRFLVWDEHHGKLIGIFALGDAVFNLRARDEYIGWDHTRRSSALVNLMDAYALGAVPPYNMLLGGKLIASLIPTQEVVRTFREKYQDSIGIITGERKNPSLVAVTTTSALGRSSLYNRLALNGRKLFVPIGFSAGWGHFHVSDQLFESMREFLEKAGDPCASSHGFGQGPNFRLRVIKKALSALGMDPGLARHGLAREVFFCPVASNALQVLRGEHRKSQYDNLETTAERSAVALSRWIIPRAERIPTFLDWEAEQFLAEVKASPNNKQSVPLRVSSSGLG